MRTEIQRLWPRTLFSVNFKVYDRVAILLNLIVALVLLDYVNVFLGVGGVVRVLRYMRKPSVSSPLTLEETIITIKTILIGWVFSTMEWRMTFFRASQLRDTETHLLEHLKASLLTELQLLLQKSYVIFKVVNLMIVHIGQVDI
jgi:hypothetical protein